MILLDLINFTLNSIAFVILMVLGYWIGNSR